MTPAGLRSSSRHGRGFASAAAGASTSTRVASAYRASPRFAPVMSTPSSISVGSSGETKPPP